MIFARQIAKVGPAVALAVGMLARASGQVVALVVTLFAVRHLTPSDFGIYAIAAAIVTIIRTLFYSATFQYLMQTSELRKYSSECLAFNIMTGIALSVVPGAALFMFPNLFGSPGIVFLFAVMAPSNFISAVTAWAEAQVLRDGTSSKYYAITALVEIVGGLVAIALLAMDFGIIALVPMVYIRPIFLLIGYACLKVPVLSDRLNWHRFVEITRWTIPQYVSSFASLFSNYGADFIIGTILNPAATGIYRAASRISSAVSDLSAQPVRLTATTIFARRIAAGRTATDMWPKVVALSLFISLPALGGLAAVADLVLPNMFGPAWAHLALVVTVLSIGRIFASAAGVATPFLVAHGRHKTLLPVQIVSAACLLLGLLMFARFGVQATAIVTAVSTMVGAVIYVTMAYRLADADAASSLRLITLAALPGLVSTVVAAAICRSDLLLDPNWLAGVAVVAAVVAWTGTVFVLRRALAPLLHPLREER